MQLNTTIRAQHIRLLECDLRITLTDAVTMARHRPWWIGMAVAAALWGLALMVVDSVAGPVPTAAYTPSLLAYAGLLGWAGWRRRLTTASS